MLDTHSFRWFIVVFYKTNTRAQSKISTDYLLSHIQNLYIQHNVAHVHKVIHPENYSNIQKFATQLVKGLTEDFQLHKLKCLHCVKNSSLFNQTEQQFSKFAQSLGSFLKSTFIFIVTEPGCKLCYRDPLFLWIHKGIICER